jgi:hypothetical protein
MDLLPVFVPGWETECCGKPFALGAQVRWHFLLLSEAESAAPAEAQLPPGSPLLAAAPGFARGFLHATWHLGRSDDPGAAVPGTVHRIRLVRQLPVHERDVVTFARTGARLTDLATSRERIAPDPPSLAQRPWQRTGFLVDLAADPAAVGAALPG